MTDSIVEMIKEKIKVKNEAIEHYWSLDNFKRVEQIEVEVSTLESVLNSIYNMIKATK